MKNHLKLTPRLLVISMLSFLVLGALPRPSSEVCVTDINCGFDVGRTDTQTINSYGYPLTVRKIMINREYKSDFSGVNEKSTSAMNYVNAVINLLIILGLFHLVYYGIRSMKSKQ